MTHHRNLLLHGLALTLRRFPAVLWTYLLNLAINLIFLLRFHSQLNEIFSKSFASQPITHGFDLGSVLSGMIRIGEGAPGGTAPNYLGIPVYLLAYFLIVPGALLCYQTGAPARLSTLVQAGLLHFWRFVRILLLSGLVMGITLGILIALRAAIATRIDDHIVGRPAFLINLATLFLVALVAAALRLYFDLVEVYTVQLGLQLRPSGKPDRRVRKTLRPALRALRLHFGPTYAAILLLTALGLFAVFLTARVAMHTLAQPRVWPMFLLGQLGLFILIFTRFWQRGVETTLSLNHPLLDPTPARTTFVRPAPTPSAPAPAAPFNPEVHAYSPAPQDLRHATPIDAIPNPEPSTPSLASPDPTLYHPPTE